MRPVLSQPVNRGSTPPPGTSNSCWRWTTCSPKDCFWMHDAGAIRTAVKCKNSFLHCTGRLGMCCHHALMRAGLERGPSNAGFPTSAANQEQMRLSQKRNRTRRRERPARGSDVAPISRRAMASSINHLHQLKMCLAVATQSISAVEIQERDIRPL